MRTLLLALLLALVPGAALAQAAQDPTPLEFRDAAEEDRFRKLVVELRCVMCQNQSLADSNAAIAQDLRHEVLALMRQDKSNTEVKEYLVDRYGEFVLYRPQMDPKTWLLWFGPALILLAGAVVVVNVVRRQAASVKNGASDKTGASAAVDDVSDDQEW